MEQANCISEAACSDCKVLLIVSYGDRINNTKMFLLTSRENTEDEAVKTSEDEVSDVL